MAETPRNTAEGAKDKDFFMSLFGELAATISRFCKQVGVDEEVALLTAITAGYQLGHALPDAPLPDDYPTVFDFKVIPLEGFKA